MTGVSLRFVACEVILDRDPVRNGGRSGDHEDDRHVQAEPVLEVAGIDRSVEAIVGLTGEAGLRGLALNRDDLPQRVARGWVDEFDPTVDADVVRRVWLPLRAHLKHDALDQVDARLTRNRLLGQSLSLDQSNPSLGVEDVRGLVEVQRRS